MSIGRRSPTETLTGNQHAAGEGTPAAAGSMHGVGKETLVESLGPPGPPIQRKEAAGGAPDGNAPAAATTFASAATGGSELPFRKEMERAFGQDFSGVKVTIGKADQMQSIGAQAATRGDEVVFADATPSKEVVAHELTHVVQNRRGGATGGVASKGELSDPHSAAEHEADTVAHRVVSGEAVEVHAAPDAGIHRAPPPGANLMNVAQLAAAAANPMTVVGWAVNPAGFNAAFAALGRTYAQLPIDAHGLKLYCYFSAFPGYDAIQAAPGTLNWTNAASWHTILDGMGAVLPYAIPRMGEIGVPQLQALLPAIDREHAAKIINEAIAFAGVPFASFGNLTAAATALLGNLAAHPVYTNALCMGFKRNIKVPLTVAQGEAARANAPVKDFNNQSMAEVEATFAQVPVGHTTNNAGLARLDRAKQAGIGPRAARKVGVTEGQYGNNAISIGFNQDQNIGSNPLTQTSQRSAVLPESMQFAGPNDPAATVASAFRYTLRHEIGHAVDERVNGKGTYCTTSAGGSWVEYPSVQAMVQAVVAAGADAFIANARARLVQQNVPNPDTFIENVLIACATAHGKQLKNSIRAQNAATGNHLTGRHVDYVYTQIDQSAPCRALRKGGFPTSQIGPWHWDDGWVIINGRTFQEGYAGQWNSYNIGARERKVSKYQFRAPGEWFAEAYAAFYEPPPVGAMPAPPRGYKLKQVDPVSWAYFATRVDRDAVTAPTPGVASANNLLNGFAAHGHAAINPLNGKTHDNMSAADIAPADLQSLENVVDQVTNHGGAAP